MEAGQVAELTYTRQVIQEAMRVYPPVAMVVRQAIAPFSLGEEQVGVGDNVVSCRSMAVHHHKSLWDEPARFDPDRWTPEAVRARHRYSYLPFGAGPRICIGMRGSRCSRRSRCWPRCCRPCTCTPIPRFAPTPKIRITMRPAEGMPMTVTPRAV